MTKKIDAARSVCDTCGGTVSLCTFEPVPWRTVGLKVEYTPEDLQVPTCAYCGETYLTDVEIAQIDAHMQTKIDALPPPTEGLSSLAEYMEEYAQSLKKKKP